MSLKHIGEEIVRFLKASSPEVLCIKGKWGVGKTYAWKRYLSEAIQANTASIRNYSYVSLFGINSLDALRYSIFESTVPASDIDAGPSLETLSFITKGKTIGRKSRPVIEGIAAVFNRKDAADALFKSAFLAVQDQLICLDDLERAGAGLDIRDILGLVSFLKEERKCKVVILLNDEKLDQKGEFERQLEKVVDVNLQFEITPSEAVDIALPPNKTLLGSKIMALGITNIRVIRKIEKVTTRIIEILKGMREEIINQAVSTATLAGFAIWQPDISPPLTFVRKYNNIEFLMRNRDALSEDDKRWSDLLSEYGYGSTDALDEEIIKGVETGYLNKSRLIDEAKLAADRIARNAGGEAFSRVWQDLYHDSLATGDDEFLDALFSTAVSDAAAITPLNINSAIRLLREYGRPDQAKEVVAAYFAAHKDEPYDFFDISSHHFSADDPIDFELRAEFDAHKKSFVDSRNTEDVVTEIARNSVWSDADVVSIAKITPDALVSIIEKLRGKDLRRAIQNLQQIGRQGGVEAKLIGTSIETALQIIGKKSPLRARKVSRYGVSIAHDSTSGDSTS